MEIKEGVLENSGNYDESTSFEQLVSNFDNGDMDFETSHNSSNKHKSKDGCSDYQSCFTRMDFRQAKQILKENRHCGLKLVKDKRHITIGWHQCGRVKEAVKRILDASLGQFRQQVQGVPLAIGKIRVPANGTVIGSQMCMHMEVVADMIVFRPKPGKVYKCVVTSIDKEYLTAKVFGAISFVASLKRAKSKPDIGDEVNIKFSALTFRGNICQMKGVLCNGEDTVTICHLLNFILLIY